MATSSPLSRGRRRRVDQVYAERRRVGDDRGRQAADRQLEPSPGIQMMGNGSTKRMNWDTCFFHTLRSTTDPRKAETEATRFAGALLLPKRAAVKAKQLSARQWIKVEPVEGNCGEADLISKIITTLACGDSTMDKAARLSLPVFSFLALASA